MLERSRFMHINFLQVWTIGVTKFEQRFIIVLGVSFGHITEAWNYNILNIILFGFGVDFINYLLVW